MQFLTMVNAPSRNASFGSSVLCEQSMTQCHVSWPIAARMTRAALAERCPPGGFLGVKAHRRARWRLRWRASGVVWEVFRLFLATHAKHTCVLNTTRRGWLTAERVFVQRLPFT
eukprot:symbB.v1.2.018047.t1/scaffold1425.1/size119490/5